MDVDGTILRHQIPHQNQPLVNHRNERIRPAAPGVAVGDLLQQVWFLVESLAADLDVHGEVGADVERRVDVDELQAARVLDLAAQGARLERGENHHDVGNCVDLWFDVHQAGPNSRPNLAEAAAVWKLKQRRNKLRRSRRRRT